MTSEQGALPLVIVSMSTSGCKPETLV